MNKKKSLITLILKILLQKEFQPPHEYFYSTTSFAIIYGTKGGAAYYGLDPIIDNVIAKRTTIKQAADYASKEIRKELEKV